MKILMMAPHPFYQERGTPIAIDLLLKSLSQAGHEIDVITYPEGEDREYPGVTYHRVKPIGKITGVKPGFSLKKLYLDLFILFKFIRLLFTNRYSVVHAVEESVYFAMLLCPIFRLPYIYDMDSSMVTQLIDKAPTLSFVEKPLRFIESLPARFAKVVVPCCDALVDDVTPYRSKKSKPTIALKDISLLDKTRAETTTGLDIQRDILGADSTPKNTKVCMYIGNLESYQGIDLMIDAFAQTTSDSELPIALIVVGGEQGDIQKYKAMADNLKVGESVYFLGKQPVSDLYALMQQADILLSPRTQGVNTPMKVYSYLDSGVPVIATRLPTHTQVMDDENSMLVEPNKVDFSRGIQSLVDDQARCRALTENAADFISREHSWNSFKRVVDEIYALV